MGLKTAAVQTLVVVAVLAGGALYTRHHTQTLSRVDFTGLEFFEDSKQGGGSRYRVLTRAADTGGTFFTVEILNKPGAPGFLPGFSASIPEHSHAQGQEEQLTILKGKLGYVMRGSRAGILGPGDTLSIPAGTSHVVFNADNATELVYTLTHSPAGPMGEAFYENLAGLAWDYGSMDHIHPLQVLVLFDTAATQLTELRGFIAPLVQHVLVPVSRSLGFKADYPSHRSKGAASTPDSADSGTVESSSSESHEEL